MKNYIRNKYTRRTGQLKKLNPVVTVMDKNHKPKVFKSKKETLVELELDQQLHDYLKGVTDA